MTTSLARLKDGYTNGGRSIALRFMQSFRSIPLTPNQLTTCGFLLNVVAGVLIYEQHWIWATVVFVAGSVIDALDGALARAHDKMTPFGGFLDSTLDRMSEGVILGAIALVLADEGDDPCPGLRVRGAGGIVPGQLHPRQGRGARPEGRRRPDGSCRADRAAGRGAAVRRRGRVLPYVIYILAALTAVTVVQRIAYVRTQLNAKSEG